MAVLVHGFSHPVIPYGHAPVTASEGSPLLAVLLTFPVAMALATGTEAPATAIGQLGQIGADDRRRFARGDLALTFLIVAGLTIGLTKLAVRPHIGIPAANSTQIADVARAASGNGLSYGLFQARARCCWLRRAPGLSPAVIPGSVHGRAGVRSSGGRRHRAPDRGRR